MFRAATQGAVSLLGSFCIFRVCLRTLDLTASSRFQYRDFRDTRRTLARKANIAADTASKLEVAGSGADDDEIESGAKPQKPSTVFEDTSATNVAAPVAVFTVSTDRVGEELIPAHSEPP